MSNFAKRTGLRIAACLVAATSLTSCTTFGPEPWEKDLMAKKPMQIDAYAFEKAAADHIFFSKEASSGGRGFAGGGCGCN
ncbi:hypothetical protein FHS83_000481 [Rhizomicrobium palustre]|uniref:DUF4266 domain-containing protein n=1 Tax=Rhizomicrobium palustre TaxID=189966 RepID=A0A846MUX6_9PROT|nr:DUF4266 domain-containing protein [Rhizomicrobium palustre]NIK87163.1 hypothetical protein [Rhizomicrobium palustre]